MGAAQVAKPQDTVEAQLSDEVVGGGGLPVTITAIATGPPVKAATSGGSSAAQVLLGGATNVTTEVVATDDPASSAGLSGGTCFATEMTDDGGTVELEVILGHPTLRS
jgi:hypothetical protein